MLGLGGLYLFGLQFRIFPIGGMVTAGAPFSVPDLLAHLALPALILGLGYVAILMRYTRSSMLEVHRLPVRDDRRVPRACRRASS